MFLERMKHIDIKCHFIHDSVNLGDIIVKRIGTGIIHLID
jgi:hypothetical protein